MYFATVFAQFMQKEAKILSFESARLHLSAARGAGNEECTRLNAILHGSVCHAAEFFYAFDLDDVRSRTRNLRAHRIEEILQIDDLGFLRRASKYRASLCLDRRMLNILRRAAARKVKQDLRPSEFFACAENAAVPLGDGHAELFERVEVQIDGPQSDVAAARVGNERTVEARQQRAEHKDGRTKFSREHGRDLVAAGVRTFDDRIPARKPYIRAQFTQDLRHALYVRDLGRFAYDNALLREDGRGKQREHGIFRRLQGDRAIQLSPAVDNVFIHNSLLSYFTDGTIRASPGDPVSTQYIV